MEIDYIKELLLEKCDSIVELLETYDFHNIRSLPNEIRCSHDIDSNATSVRIKLVEGLPSTDFSRGIKGDVFSLIMNVKHVSFFEVIQKTKYILGLGDNIQVKQKPKLFGGVYDSIGKKKSNVMLEVKTYDMKILDDYRNGYCTKFLKDGISLKCQKYFDIGYDYNSDRITVPWYTFDGQLIGIMGRYNGNLKETHAKWFPIIPFSKSSTLYGFHQNYQTIVESDEVYIGESEKFVMQLYTMGYYNSVALGGNSICENQIKQIISTQPKRIIFALDEGLDVNVTIANCLRVKELGSKFGIQVGYIFDTKNKYLELNGKQSPSDLGKQVFEKLISECIIYI